MIPGFGHNVRSLEFTQYRDMRLHISRVGLSNYRYTLLVIHHPTDIYTIYIYKHYIYIYTPLLSSSPYKFINYMYYTIHYITNQIYIYIYYTLHIAFSHDHPHSPGIHQAATSPGLHRLASAHQRKDVTEAAGLASGRRPQEERPRHDFHHDVHLLKYKR